MYALEIENLTKIYKTGVKALDNISFNVEQGDFFALLGPNGAGKSTTLGVISTLVKKTAGNVRIFGHDLEQEAQLAKALTGVMPQEINFNPFDRVQTILLQQAGYYGISGKMAKQRAEYYLKKLALWSKRDARILALSGGMKRRLMIARALIHSPKLLVLDEPTAGVDIEIRRSVWEFIQEINQRGTTVILTTHYLEEAESLCKNIAIINNGHIIENAPMQKFLKKLQFETFVLYLKNPIAHAPQLAHFAVEWQDEQTLEVSLSPDESLNNLFQALTAQGIEVSSLRNKTNRLEELFLRLTGIKGASSEQQLHRIPDPA